MYSIVNKTSGLSQPDGYFRFVFAAYGTKDEEFAHLFDSDSPFFQSTPQLSSGKGTFTVANSPVQFFYTSRISPSDLKSPEKLLEALEDLSNPGEDLFQVKLLDVGKYQIKISPSNKDTQGYLSANVPQLFPISEITLPIGRGLTGTDAYIQVYTLKQGIALKPQDGTELAVIDTLSPCRAEGSKRASDFDAAYGDLSKLYYLDSLAASCALYGDSISNCVGPNAALDYCSWRGVDAPLLSEDFVDPKSILQIWNPPGFSFFKLGNTSNELNSNCTVNLIVTLQTMLAMQQPLVRHLLDANKTGIAPSLAESVKRYLDMYSSLVLDVDKFSRCNSNPTIAYSNVQGTFVDVWQWLVTTTSYTCMLAYGLAGALLAYRMDKFKLLGFKWWDTLVGIIIIVCSVCLGGLFGFVTGAVPAALITQMYASIPVSLTADWAISLGVAQGILIVYFDMGRGGAEAEIAMKNGG